MMVEVVIYFSPFNSYVFPEIEENRRETTMMSKENKSRELIKYDLLISAMNSNPKARNHSYHSRIDL